MPGNARECPNLGRAWRPVLRQRISSKSHRREFLRVSGVCLALPWLECFAAANEAAAAPGRAVFIYVPNGVNMWEWHPAKTGEDYELTPPLKNLAGCGSDSPSSPACSTRSNPATASWVCG